MSARHAERQEHLLDNCPFCRIISGNENQKDRIFFENDTFIAMLDKYPASLGHFLVFPKVHRSNLNEMQEELSAYLPLVHRLAEEAVAALGAQAYVLKLNNNIYMLDPDPNHVGHVHMHVIPHYKEEQAEVEGTDDYFAKVMYLLTKEENT